MVRNSTIHDQQRSMQQECMSGVSSSCHWHIAIRVSRFISLFIIPSWSFPESMMSKVFLFSILAKSKEKIIYNSKKLYRVSFSSFSLKPNTPLQKSCQCSCYTQHWCAESTTQASITQHKNESHGVKKRIHFGKQN